MAVYVKGHFFRDSAGEVGTRVSSYIKIPLDGIAVLECESTYSGTTYNAGESIGVERGETLYVHHTIQDTDYESFELSINGGEFKAYWGVLRRFVREIARETNPIIDGTDYGTLKNLTLGIDHPFTESSDIIDSTRDQVVLDKKNNEAWVFGIGTVKVSCPSDLIDAVSTPKWSTTEVPAKTYIVCSDHIIEYAEGSVVATRSLPYPAMSASGSTDNRIVILGDNVLYYYDFETGAHELIHKKDDDSNTLTTGGKFFSSSEDMNFGYVFVAPDGSIVVVTDYSQFGFTVTYATEGGRGSYHAFLGILTRLTKIDITADYVFAIDSYHNALHRISTGDRSVSSINFFNVPSGMALNEVDGNIWISFYDSTEVRVYSPQFELLNTIDTGIKNNGLTFSNGDIFVTDIFSNATEVSYLLPRMEGTNSYDYEGEYNRGFHDYLPMIDGTFKASDYWSDSFLDDVVYGKPAYLFTDPREATVLINGSPFTEGWVRDGDTYDVVYNGIELYATDYVSKMIGSGAYTVRGTTELKLFPDLVVLPQLNGAQLNRYYYEAYTVGGITQGETSTIMSDGNVLEFLINLDEELTADDLDYMDFVKQGNVVNGDRVLVRSRVKNLFPAREPYYLYSEGEKVVSWTILPMLLEGTEVRKRSTQEIDRSAHLWLEHNRQEAVHKVETIAQLNEYSAALSFGMMDSKRMSFSANDFEGMTSDVMASPTVGYYGGNTYGVQEEPTVKFFDSAYDVSISSNVFDKDAPAFSYSGIPISVFDKDSLYSIYDTKASYIESLHSYEVSNLGDNGEYGFDNEFNFQRAVPALPRFIPMPVKFYARRVFNDPIFYTNLYVKNVLAHHIDVKETPFVRETENFNFFNVYFTNIQYDGKYYVDSMYGVREMASYLTFLRTPEVLKVGKPYKLDAPEFEVLKRSLFSPFELFPEKQILSIAAQFSLSPEKSVYSVNKVNVGGYTFIGNTSKFLNTSQNDGFGGFLTEAQAVAYAQSLGFDTSDYVTVQFGSGWIFRSNITNTDLVCSIVDNGEGGITHKFGYIHGG